MQMVALTLKISENNDKIDDLLKVDKNIKNDVSSNLRKISTNEGAISSNLGKINNIKNEMDIKIKKDIYEKHLFFKYVY